MLAREAEEAGWDGVFYYDAICVGEMETYDPWVMMAAMAMETERVRLGAIFAPGPPPSLEARPRDDDVRSPFGRPPRFAGGPGCSRRRRLLGGWGADGAQGQGGAVGRGAWRY